MMQRLVAVVPASALEQRRGKKFSTVIAREFRREVRMGHYPQNGARAMARRMRQTDLGQLKPENGLK